MQIEEVGEVREATTSGLPALGNEPFCLEQAFLFFFGENSPKGDTAQIFWLKSPFFLKIILPDCARFQGANRHKCACSLHF
jgi:hypothetical protein